MAKYRFVLFFVGLSIVSLPVFTLRADDASPALQWLFRAKPENNPVGATQSLNIPIIPAYCKNNDLSSVDKTSGAVYPFPVEKLYSNSKRVYDFEAALRNAICGKDLALRELFRCLVELEGSQAGTVDRFVRDMTSSYLLSTVVGNAASAGKMEEMGDTFRVLAAENLKIYSCLDRAKTLGVLAGILLTHSDIEME